MIVYSDELPSGNALRCSVVYPSPRVRSHFCRHVAVRSGRLRQKWLERRKRKRIPDLSKILTRAEHLAVLRELDAPRRKWLPLVALIGAGMLAFGIWRGRELMLLQSIGARTEGTVVRIESETNPNGEGSRYTDHSVVQFEAGGGREVTFRDAVGPSHPIDARGEVLGVISDPDDPARAIIDRGFWNWAIPGGCGLFGVGGWILFPAGRRSTDGSLRSSSGYPPTDRSAE